MKPDPKVGQRWLWDRGIDKAIGEISEKDSYGKFRMTVIQVICGTGVSGYGLNKTFNPELRSDGWSYLPGQDRPQ